MSIHRSDPGGNTSPTPDPSLAGRLYLLLQAALRQPVISSDDALLADELDSCRKGNAKLVGQAVVFAHRAGWIRPIFTEAGRRMSKKSARKRRACGIVELWTKTPSTLEGLRWAERVLTRKPPPRDLFDEID
jgi:hypothetical protein